LWLLVKRMQCGNHYLKLGWVRVRESACVCVGGRITTLMDGRNLVEWQSD
jgi:hypothetical protein